MNVRFFTHVTAYGLLCSTCGGTPPARDTSGVTQTIGPEGGSIASEDARLRITIPPGALETPVDITISEFTGAPASIGPAYHVSPEQPLAQAITVTYGYAGLDLGGRAASELVIGRSIQDDWDRLDVVALDDMQLTTSCEDDRLSFGYGLLERFGPASSTSASRGTATTDEPMRTTTASSTDGPTATTAGSTSMGTGTETETGDSSGSPQCDDGQADPGEFCYVEGLSFATGTAPQGLASDDLNGDGAFDLVVAASMDNTIVVRLGLGNGLFSASSTVTTSGSPAAIALSDLDADGVVDAIVTNDGGVQVALGDGTGAFVIQPPVAAGTGVFSLRIGDFDENGDLDVVVANRGDTTVGWLAGDGTGVLAAMVTFESGGNPQDIALGDFTGNGNVDIITAIGNDVALLAGNGMGGFGSPSAVPIGGASTQAVATADFNGDGQLDFAVADAAQTVTVHLGSGVGTFGGGIPFTTGENPIKLVAQDINDDQAIDLVAVCEEAGVLSILAGNGMGSFDAAQELAVGGSPRDVTIADFNQDGVVDFAVTNFSDNNTSILLSRP